ncbi:MAG TPA: hypothetical protein VFB54_05340 [Burkholderiales bacterium]|nr:hypothetical protein [Burkholderiales bacterium]
MNHQQTLITVLGLMAALSSVPARAADDTETYAHASRHTEETVDARGASQPTQSQADQRRVESRPSYKLSLEQMDKVNAGAINPFWSFMFDICPDCVVNLIMEHGLNIYE